MDMDTVCFSGMTIQIEVVSCLRLTVTFLDQHYETIRELRAGNAKLSDKHEAHIINEETTLIQIYQPTPTNLKEWGASPEQQWIVNAIIQGERSEIHQKQMIDETQNSTFPPEMYCSNGLVLTMLAQMVREYLLPNASIQAHILLEAILPLNPGQAGSGYNSSDAWDYFHINSVDKDANGDYIVSARDACAVHKINGTTGEIIWRLGGKKSDFALDKDANFCFQHHARYLKQYDDVEVISLYDNAAHGTENRRGHEVHTAPTSSGKILKLNTTSWEATLVQGFYPPDGLRSKSQGSTQILPNGGAFVNWGSEGAVTEFRADGTPIFHAYLDSGFLGEGVQGYRGFRFNWTGLPNETPAIAALENSTHTTIYVSWNGDTEARIWRFYGVTDSFGSRQFLGESRRTGFETSLSVKKGQLDLVVAEAIDGSGKLLVTTSKASVKEEILPPKKKQSQDNQKPREPLFNGLRFQRAGGERH